MPELRITLDAGVSSDPTPTLNRTGWSSSNLVRWQDEAYLQPVGGWSRWNSTPVVGTARSMHPWQDLNNNDWLAVGTEQRLQVYGGGAQQDITPITKTDSLTAFLSTTINTPTVKVTDTGHGASVGDWVYFQIPMGIGGLVIWKYQKVASVIDGNNFTITAISNATGTVNNGGHTPQFTTTNLSSTVTVTLNNHGYTVGQIFTVQVSTTVATVVLNGEYLVQTVPTANTFTITAGSAANAGTSAYENADNENLSYLLPSGQVTTIALTGWGAGTWGSGTWGNSGGGGSVGLDRLRIWSLDNFGQNLQAVPGPSGGLYQWIPPSTGVATTVSGAPTKNAGMFVAMPQEIVVCWGSETLGTQDPLLIRWSDAGNNTVWTASATNQAGSYRLSRGSRIVGALQGPQSAYIWTDTDLWAMTYIQPPFIFSFTIIASHCGLIAQQAAGVLNTDVYWMSQRNFWKLAASGSAQPLVVPVWDEVFGTGTDIGINPTMADKCFAAGDTPFNEMWFYFAHPGETEPNAFVKINVLATYSSQVSKLAANIWDHGHLTRTAWIDQSLFGMPIAVDINGYLQQHETGTTANGLPITSADGTGQFAQSGYADIQDGGIYQAIQQLIPDFKWLTDNASLNITYYGQNFPGDTPVTKGPFQITSTTTYKTIRIRKRQIAIRIDFDGTSLVRLGALRHLVAPAGRR